MMYTRTWKQKKKITLNDFQNAELNINVPSNTRFEAHVNSSEHLKFSENGVIKNNLNAVNYRTTGLLRLIYELRDNIDEVFIGGIKGDYLISKNGDLKLTGNFLKMNTLYISGLSLKGFGVYLAIGIGAKIIVNQDVEILKKIIGNEKRKYKIVDVSNQKEVGQTTFSELKQSILKYKKHELKTGSLSSIYLSEKISEKMMSM